MSKQQYPLYGFLIGLYAAFFLLLRLPLYCSFNLPIISYDSPNYVLIKTGAWYIFDRRLPVYVLFVEGITTLMRDVNAVALAQTAISFIVSVSYLIYASKSFKKYFLLHLLFVMLTYCNVYTVCFEMSLLSESLFFNLLFLFFQFQYLSFETGIRKYWLVSGILITLLLLLKQAAVFLIPATIVIACWLIYKRNIRILVSYFGPPCISLLLFCFYNYLSLGLFTYSPFGGLNLVGTVSTFIGTSSSYTATTNTCISKIKSMVSNEEIVFINDSWDFKKMQIIFHKHYNNCWKLHECLSQSNNIPNHEQLVTFDRQYYDIAHSAILHNKVLYFKFFSSMLVEYFRTINEPIFLDKHIAVSYTMGNEVANTFKNSKMGFVVNKMADSANRPDKIPVGSWWVRLSMALFYVLGLVEFSLLWVGIQLILLIAGVVLFFRKGCLSAGIALFMFMATANLFNGIGTSLVEETFYRYSFPYFFTYYYGIAALPMFYYFLKDEA